MSVQRGAAAALTAAILAAPGPTTAAWGQYARTITFSGYTWGVKKSSGKVGPGPNYFSDSAQSVWVDAQGRLHLKIERRNGRWQCAEVVCTQSLGYGTYRFYLDSPVDNLDPYVVLGLFTWNDAPAYNHREIDIEFSRWGQAVNQNAQYVVQPYTQPENIVRFDEPPGLYQSTHSFRWQSDSVFFRSLRGHNAATFDPGDVIKEWTYTGAGVPAAGGESPRLNLWLFQGRAPTNRQAVEIIINRFEFVPSP